MASSILALDLGTRTGWATYTDGELRGGVWRLAPKKDEPKGIILVNLNRHLAALNPRPTVIVYESVMSHTIPGKRLPNGQRGKPTFAVLAAHRYGALKGKVLEAAAVWGIEAHGIAVGTLKKDATLNGRASKPEMMAAAALRWQVEVIDDNHGDALCALSAWLGGWRP